MSHCSDFDLFVVGGGSGGVRAARIAAGYGAKVAIAEEYRFGGTCVIRGCVPKKLLVYASRFRDDFEDAVGFGWTGTSARFDWPTLIANKDAEIARLEGLYRAMLDKAGVRTIAGRAELADAHTLSVQPGNRRVTARVILIATGGRPVFPEVPGVGHAITSNEAFHLDRLPRSIVIVGGGYIAVEFACIFRAFDVATTLVYRGPKILRGFDEHLRDALTEELQKRGIDVVCGAEIATDRQTLDRIDRDFEQRQYHCYRSRSHVRYRPQAQHGWPRPRGGRSAARVGGTKSLVDEQSRSSVRATRRRRRDGPRKPLRRWRSRRPHALRQLAR